MDIFHVVDPHDGRPCASIYAAVDPETGRIIVFAETPEDAKKAYWNITLAPTIEKETSAWKDIERLFGLESSTIVRIMDKKMGWQTRGRRTFDELFQEQGFFFEKSYLSKGEEGEIALGHRKVKEYLKPLRVYGDKNQDAPGLVIWNTLTHVPEGMKKYTKRKRKGVEASNYAKSDGKIVEKYKDFPDTIRYLVMAVIGDDFEEGVSRKNQLRNAIRELQDNDDEDQVTGYATY
jgi:hypothetical protein